MTSLHLAAAFGNVDLVKILLKELEDHDPAELQSLVNLELDRYGTPLSLACVGNHVHIISLLVAHGADMNRPMAMEGLHATVLQAAVHWGHEAVVAELARCGADLDARLPGLGVAPLFLAIEPSKGDSMLELLLRLGADADSLTGMAGRTVLFTAVGVGAHSKVNVLLRGGADVNWRADRGGTPLMAAVNAGSVDMAILLLEAGASVDARNELGETALSLAAQEGDEAMVTALIDAGADVDAADSVGLTPLCEAKRCGYEGVFRLLVAAGADQTVLERLRLTRGPDGTVSGSFVVPPGEEDAAPEWRLDEFRTEMAGAEAVGDDGAP